jgi:ribosomal protein S21
MPTNIEVRQRGKESADKLIKRFIKKCKKKDIVREYLDKTLYFKPKSQKRREKRKLNAFLKSKNYK